jgi:hypothetical protein
MNEANFILVRLVPFTAETMPINEDASIQTAMSPYGNCQIGRKSSLMLLKY